MPLGLITTSESGATRTFPSVEKGPRGILAAMPGSKLATALVAVVGIAIAGGVGYLLHKEARSRMEARAVVRVVGDATEQIKSAFKTVPPGALDKVEEGLRKAKGWSNAELAEATEHYLIGAREILRRRAEAERLTQKAAASRAELAAHMQNAGKRDPRWIRTATQLKKQVERDHFELEMQLSALATLLESLPEANKRLAPLVETSLLLEEPVRKRGYQGVIQEAKRARAELEKTRTLLPR